MQASEQFIKANDALSNVSERKKAWCKATGLQPSRAKIQTVFRWLYAHDMPIGFDHTCVFYHPPTGLHIILTEPYHSTGMALLSLRKLAERLSGSFNFAEGKPGTGIWYPGSCMPLLVGGCTKEMLEVFAALLPNGQVSNSYAATAEAI